MIFYAIMLLCDKNIGKLLNYSEKSAKMSAEYMKGANRYEKVFFRV